MQELLLKALRLTRHFSLIPVTIKDAEATAGSYDAAQALSSKPVIIKDAGAIVGSYDAGKALSIKPCY